MLKINLKCPNCRTLICSEVDAERPDQAFACLNCGVLFKPKLTEIRNKGLNSMLTCLPLGNSLVSMPLGTLIDGRRRETCYRGPDGNTYSRDEYKATFKLDPKIYLEWIKNGRCHDVDGFECRELACDEDPLKLKEELIGGMINKSDYLDKIRILWKCGKLSQSEYDDEVKRIIMGL